MLKMKRLMFGMGKKRKSVSAPGFTLVEAIVAISLFVVIAVASYGSFRNGFVAYQRIEAKLGNDHELNMLVRNLDRELRNALYFAEVPFEGESDRIHFPSPVRHFDGKRMRDEWMAITYQFRGSKLERIEEKLRKGFREEKGEKESLLTLESCRFQFAFRKRDGGIEWKNDWKETPYMGFPRAIRLTVQGKSSGGKQSEPNEYQFLLPQGMLPIEL